MSTLITRLSGAPVATLIQIALALIVAVVGGAVTLLNPDTLSFEDYVKYLGVLSVGNGLLGVGRGLDNKPKLIEGELVTTELRAAPPPGT